MQINDTLHGFTVTRTRALPELNATLVEMHHKGSGAHLAWLDRKDENKTFSIAFKTLPNDSTGVFHILEHSVLCGSDKYPVKEPFVELLKSSVQTFLNAFTFPDKTVYPVCSRNDRDFLNLIDVYLDAVLHPAIYKNPSIFRQEGWRYEGEGENLGYQGVVFNEMKGAFSSPQTVLYNEMQRVLFPDNCYRYVSGGDPRCIPDLTYEQFIANHKKYYHPSNARISLVGSVDLNAVLEKIDSFLSAFTPLDADFSIPMQQPIEQIVEVVPFEIGADEPKENRAIIACASILGRFDDKERAFALSVLSDYLTGDNDAPLKRAVIDSGLAQDFSVLAEEGQQQLYGGWTALNTERENQKPLEALVRDTITKILENGLDRERLSACLHQFAFNLRDREGKGWPRGLDEALSMLDTWLYDGDPADGLLIETALSSLENHLNDDYFASLLSELFLNNPHTATIVLVPDQTLGEAKRKAEAARVKRESEAWTEDDKAKLAKEAEALKAWQQTPDSEEALKTIPMLKLSDLNDRPQPLTMSETELHKVPVLNHTVDSDLAFFKAHLAANDLKLEELSVLSLLCRMIGNFATERHSRAALPMAIKNTIGRFDVTPTVLPGSDPTHCRVMLSASIACLKEQAEPAIKLLAELLTETIWDDLNQLKELMQQMAVGAKMSLASDGMRYAMMRVASYKTAAGAANERIGGITFVKWINEVLEGGESAWNKLLCEMRELLNKLAVRERLVVSRSEAAPLSAVETLILGLPNGTVAGEQACYPLPGAMQEGIAIPAQISYAVMGSNLFLHDRQYSGSFPVLQNILNFHYLWNEIRVQGGAYGCGFVARDSGDVAIYTYRDPQPNRSLGVMRRAADFVRTFCAADPDLTGPILSSVSAFDPLRNSEEKIAAAETRRFRGITEETAIARYQALLHTTPEALLSLCGALEDLANDNLVCVAGGTNLLDTCKETLQNVITV